MKGRPEVPLTTSDSRMMIRRADRTHIVERSTACRPCYSDGSPLSYKRLESGVSTLPRVLEVTRSVKLHASELAMVLDGMDIDKHNVVACRRLLIYSLRFSSLTETLAWAAIKVSRVRLFTSSLLKISRMATRTIASAKRPAFQALK